MYTAFSPSPWKFTSIPYSIDCLFLVMGFPASDSVVSELSFTFRFFPSVTKKSSAFFDTLFEFTPDFPLIFSVK